MGDKTWIGGKIPGAKRNQQVDRKQKAGSSFSTISPADHVLVLQRAVGNQAVERLYRSGLIQAKLTVGKSDDVYEQEADRVADEVMRMPDPVIRRRDKNKEEEESIIQPKSLSQRITPVIQLQCEEEKYVVQAQLASYDAPVIPPQSEAALNALQGQGHPLPESSLAFFEPRFGHYFSQVRIHTDNQTADIAHAINAQAFTHGRDIFFNTGRFQPQTPEGQKLLAHELTHVLQQTHFSSRRGNSMGGIDPASCAVDHALSWLDRSAKIAINSLDGEEGMKGLVLRKGGGTPQTNMPPQQIQQNPSSEEIYFSGFQKRWRDRPDSETRLHELIQHLVALQYPDVPLVFYGVTLRIPITREPQRKEIIRNAAERFVAWAEPQIISELKRDPATGAQAWQSQLLRWGDRLNTGRLADFRRRLQKEVIEGVALQAEAAAMARTRTPRREVRRLADLKVRNIIKDMRQDFDISTEAGVNAWHMQRSQPDSEALLWSSAADIIGAAGTILAVIFPPVTLVAGVVAVSFAAAGGVAGGMAYFLSNKQQEEAYRMQLLEDSIKEAVRIGFEHVSDAIEAKLDVFSIVSTVEALNAGIDIDRIGADELENFLWPKLFGREFPQGRTLGRRFVMEKMNENLSRSLPSH